MAVHLSLTPSLQINDFLHQASALSINQGTKRISPNHCFKLE